MRDIAQRQSDPEAGGCKPWWRRSYWPLSVVSVVAGIIAYPFAALALLAWGFSHACDDNGYCSPGQPLALIVQHEGVIGLTWLAVVIVVVCLLPGDTPRPARILGALTTAAVLVACIGAALLLRVPQLMLAAMVVPPFAGGVVAGSDRLCARH